jgi:demethylmenaquinone methyltransferase/2-methoxy-6-polyprenyl-1,4-benzoquinol methylase
MNWSEQEVSRVRASVEDIKNSYSLISRFYAIFEGLFEKRLRQRGLELLAVTSGEVVLEIGIGTGHSLKEIANSVGQSGRACGLDITPRMLEISRKRLEKAGLIDRVELCEGDARSMPYEDDRFDATYMASTLELFDTPDIPGVLKEIKRVLKPSGRLGVASLTREGREDSLFVKFYEWLHRRMPKYASCRPIYVEKSVEEAGFQITRSVDFVLYKIVPWKIVTASPKTDL